MKYEIETGDLRHRIGIFARVQTPDATAGIQYTDTQLCRVWAKVEPRKGSTYLYSQQTDVSTTHEIIIRYRKNITSENWIKYTQKVFRTNDANANDSLQQIKLFRIRGVKDLMLQEWFLVLNCEEYFET